MNNQNNHKRPVGLPASQRVRRPIQPSTQGSPRRRTQPQAKPVQNQPQSQAKPMHRQPQRPAPRPKRPNRKRFGDGKVILWDRVAILLILFLLILWAMVSCTKKVVSSFGKDTEPDSTEITETTEATEAPTEVFVDTSLHVFLSPSNQNDNIYAGTTDVTEAYAMRQLGNAIMQKLMQLDGYSVSIATPVDTLDQKIDKANNNGNDIYLCLHTNAGGASGDGCGTEAYYNPGVEGSEELTRLIYKEVAELTPTTDRGYYDGTGNTDAKTEYREVRMAEIPICFLEAEFHDQANLAKWITDNTDAIADAVVQGLENYKEGLEP